MAPRASEPRERAAADDPTLVVADSPARSEQVIRRTTLGARCLHRDTTHDVNDALSGLGQAKNLAELGLNDRDRLDLAYQHIVLASPRHPATGESRDDVIVVIEDLHLVRGEITISISLPSRVSAHNSAKYFQKPRKLLFAVREIAFPDKTSLDQVAGL